MLNTRNRARVLLIYPFFRPKFDRSVFRFPPLGVSYVASSLRRNGHDVSLLDCTFMSRQEAARRAEDSGAEIVGIYSMVTMLEDSLFFANRLRSKAALLIAGGPLPSSDPAAFLGHFDLVIKGEGEKPMTAVATAHLCGADVLAVPGVVSRDASGIRYRPGNGLEQDPDSLPFPARDLLPNSAYIDYGKKKYGYSITSMMTTRGCPFACEFCSNEVFGVSYRERSVDNVLDEAAEVLSLGYERIHFGDDVFTMKKERVMRFCDGVRARRMAFKWECLARADRVDAEMARAMKDAGCEKIYFGIESGNQSVLERMNKRITPAVARSAVEAAHSAGIRTGAFFILFYPGETDETVLDTLRYSRSLPLDYVSYTVPYPIPGTALHRRMQGRGMRAWKQDGSLSGHSLTFAADFSEAKMKFGILKGAAEFAAKKYLGELGVKMIEKPTDLLLRLMR
jgi:anaerobic magnesium-protoporphyrin IX monomethyl ester cyclase